MLGVRGRALSHPPLPALWAGCRGPLPTGRGCGGVRGWGPVTNPTARALLRAVGAAGRRPGGAPPAWVWGVRGRALSQPRLPALWAGCRGLLPTGCGFGGLRAWGPVTNPTARSLASWLCALWGRHVGARGGRLLPGCGASGVGRSPTRDCPPSGRAAGAHYPLAVGVGGCGHGDPSPTPQRAGFARCGGGMRVPGGGASCLGVGRPGSGALPAPTARPLGGLPAPTTYWLWVRGGAGVGTRYQPHSARFCELALHAVGAARGCPGGAPLAWVWGVWGRALIHPPLPPLWAGCRGPLPTGRGCGGVRAWGPVTNPTARALLRAVKAARRRPGGAPPAWVWGIRGWALSQPRLTALWAGCRGLLPTGCGCWGVRAWGPVTNPTARALARWLCALWGQHKGAWRGAPPAWVWGVRGRRLSQPRLPALWAGCRGPLPTGCGCGGVRAWGPVTNPTARAFASWLCALWGRHEGARGGRLLPGCGASGVRRSPTPDCPPSRRAAGADYPLAVGAGGCGRGDPSPTPQRALLRAGFARCGGGTRATGGGASCLGVGRPGSGTLPSPTARPLGGLPGPTTHWLWVRGVAGMGTRHRPNSARSCELALRAVGAARGCPGGAPPAWVWGVRGRALSHPRLPALWAGCRGPLPTGCGCGGVRAWGPVTDPTARCLCALLGRHEGAWGGRLLPGRGASGVGRSPVPDCPPSGRAAGAHHPLAVGAGGCGHGDAAPTQHRALLRAGFARCGGGTRVPGGGAPCLGVGHPGSGALPPPTARPLGGLPGPTTHWLWVWGGAGVGTRHRPHSALPLRAAGAA